jgi:hypothetical protein
MKEVLFIGLGPQGNYSHNGNQYVNGDVMVCEEAVADELINNHLAVDINDGSLDVSKTREQIKKDDEARQAILMKGGKK